VLRDARGNEINGGRVWRYSLQHTDEPDALTSLCACDARPSSGRAGEQRNKFASPHGKPRAAAIGQSDYYRKLALCGTTKSASDVRFGSKADICGAKTHVCFTPESGHSQCTNPCPLWANSGHRPHSITSSAHAYAEAIIAKSAK
jgi:hypothetical protein